MPSDRSRFEIIFHRPATSPGKLTTYTATWLSNQARAANRSAAVQGLDCPSSFRSQRSAPFSGKNGSPCLCGTRFSASARSWTSDQGRGSCSMAWHLAFSPSQHQLRSSGYCHQNCSWFRSRQVFNSSSSNSQRRSPREELINGSNVGRGAVALQSARGNPSKDLSGHWLLQALRATQRAPPPTHDTKDTEPRITASFHLPMQRQLASRCLQSDESHKGTVSHQSKSSKPVVSSESRRPERLLLNSELRALVAEPRRPMSLLRALSAIETRWPMFTSSSFVCLRDSLRLVPMPPSLPLPLPLPPVPRHSSLLGLGRWPWAPRPWLMLWPCRSHRSPWHTRPWHTMPQRSRPRRRQKGVL
mmetsp:Transcript_87949/g.284003  ORF Transcript_87949/g.284003 Transcript_87949/m.284003 type:complete len:359 (-) Transcript_87949:668-1744(-)